MSTGARPNAVPQGHQGSAAKDINAKLIGPWTWTPADVMKFFPKGFTPREQQITAIDQIAKAFSAGKKYAVLEMPTGGGKSFICYSFADCLREHGGTHFLTIQKQLQRQYASDFPAPQIEVLMGRANYACTHTDATPGMDAAHGVCRQRNKGILIDCVDVDASGWTDFDEDGNPRGILRAAGQLELPACAHKCPYWLQLQKCSDAGVTLFNFSSFLFQTRIGRFGKRALMIIDEGHNVEAELMKFVTLELNEWALSLVNIQITKTISSKDQFVEWLRETDLLRLVQDSVKAAEGAENDPEGFGKEEADALRELEMKIENFMAYLEKTQWVLETAAYRDRLGDDRRKIVARPLYAKDFAEDLLFKHADHVLFMSATILDAQVWAGNLGIKMSDLEHVQSPCDFPVENRPIFLEYAGNLGFKYFTPEQNPSNPTKPKFIHKIKQIMARHQGQRGIIHCHSFELSKILKYDVADSRFLFQDDFKGGKDEMLKVHGQRTDSVIVAPALHEGLDLKDSLSRFQVIAKVPWPSMMDKVIKERMAIDQKWYGWLTALKTVQSIGRSVRCFDLDTEILTTDGWKTADTLKAGDIAFGVDPKALDGKPGRRSMRWGRVGVIPNRVLKINRPEAPEPTVHIKTNAVDIIVTADHTMLVQARSVSTYTQVTRRNGHEWAYKVPHTNKTMGLTRVPAGELPSRFKLPCAGWIKHRAKTNHSSDWFWLMGFIIGDGHISKSKNQIAIYQSTAESQREHVVALNGVLQRLKIKYQYYEARQTGTCFGYERNGKSGVWAINGFDSSRIRDMFHRGEIRRYSKLKIFRHKTHKGVEGWKDVEKRIPRWILNRATPTEMLHLLAGMMASDGSATSTSKRSPEHVNGMYWTSDRILADQLQELLALCGYRSSITLHRPAAAIRKDQWCVLLNNPATSDVVHSASVKPGPTTKVWCPSTEFGSVIARRNGKTFVAGNSKTDWAYTYIVDQGFDGFLARNGQMIPRYIKDAFQKYAPKEIRRD